MKEQKNNPTKNWKESWGINDSLQYLRRENNLRCKGAKKLFTYIDAPLALVKYGATFHDYMELKFYEKGQKERSSFLTTKMVQRVVRDCPKDLVRTIDDKSRFNDFFADFIDRQWLDLEKCSFDDFKRFALKNDTFFIKAKRESSAVGIEKIITKDVVDLQELYNHNRTNMVEETIQQHPIMSKMNPSCINSVKVSTVSDSIEPKVFACYLRSATGSEATDNCATGGLLAQINPENGRCFTDGFNFVGNCFKQHPLTGTVINGFQIPYWDGIIETVLQAARLVPEVKNIGWDIAVNTSGCELIEGNPGGGPAPLQLADNIGKKELFYQLMEKK